MSVCHINQPRGGLTGVFLVNFKSISAVFDGSNGGFVSLTVKPNSADPLDENQSVH